ncbi:MAG: glycosyltransferase family 4 protein [Acutalibacteraceae bacterium]
MNVLFLTLLDFNSLEKKNIYTDLLREFAKNGHNTVVISPRERRFNEETRLITENNRKILKLKIGNIQKTGLIEKGISTLLLESRFKNGVKKYFGDIKFDLVLYSTPPITFAGVVEYIKKRDNAKAYLLLKDIFPQNAVDMGMMTKTGVKSVIYKVFRRKEKQLYKLSDYIGCMSQANVDYILRHNPEIGPEKVHISPNSIEVNEKPDSLNREETRRKYGIPLDKTVFIYGGNLGKPQDIPFIIECLRANEKYDDRYFVICGTGTEYPKLKKYVDESAPKNVLLINGLPKDEYESFVGCCDVGLIFLDRRFTIPNFPSRLLSYMQNSMPVLACTDPNTDIGKVIAEGDFGWWCESDNPDNFTKAADKALQSDLHQIGKNGFDYLINNYSVENSYNAIMQRIEK